MGLDDVEMADGGHLLERPPQLTSPMDLPN